MRRYDRELSLEIDRTVARFNNKIKRLEKQERKLDLPEPIERSDIITSSSSKSTIQRKLKEYQKFLERGAEEVVTTQGGVEISKYELNQLKERQRNAKISYSKELKRLRSEHPTVAGKKQKGTFESMGDERWQEIMAKRRALEKDINKQSEQEFERLRKKINKGSFRHEQDATFKENYLSMLEKTSYTFGIDKRKFDEIKRKLKTLSPAEFVKLYNTDKAIKDIYYKYLQMMSTKKQEDFDALQNSAEDLIDEIYNNIDEIIESRD